MAALGLLPVLPEIARAADIETIPIVASILIISGAIQRVISTPSVDNWLRRYTHIAARPQPPTGKHHLED